jgi:hypothetical protein
VGAVEEKARERRVSWRSLRVWGSFRAGRLRVSLDEVSVRLLEEG